MDFKVLNAWLINMWKDICGFKNRYEIDEDGNIRNKKTSRILVQKIDKYGYSQIGLRKLGERSKIWFRIHRLVVQHFHSSLPSNWEEFQVDHIDHIKSNNSISNLRLVTSVENCISRTLKPWKTNKTTGELYISKYKNGFMIRINRSDYKQQKWTLTLDEAILYRDKFLDEIRALRGKNG